MVVDLSGNGIANVEVVVINSDFTFNTTTDQNGNYTINNMYEGNYEIISGLWGYITSCVNEYITPSTINTTTLEEGYYDDFTFDFDWTVSGSASVGMWESGFSEVTDIQWQEYNPD
jgi:phosphatidate phosphatase APP1